MKKHSRRLALGLVFWGIIVGLIFGIAELIVLLRSHVEIVIYTIGFGIAFCIIYATGKGIDDDIKEDK